MTSSKWAWHNLFKKLICLSVIFFKIILFPKKILKKYLKQIPKFCQKQFWSKILVEKFSVQYCLVSCIKFKVEKSFILNVLLKIICFFCWSCSKKFQFKSQSLFQFCKITYGSLYQIPPWTLKAQNYSFLFSNNFINETTYEYFINDRLIYF